MRSTERANCQAAVKTPQYLTVTDIHGFFDKKTGANNFPGDTAEKRWIGVWARLKSGGDEKRIV
jgi:hypothetical protein